MNLPRDERGQRRSKCVDNEEQYVDGAVVAIRSQVVSVMFTRRRRGREGAKEE